MWSVLCSSGFSLPHFEQEYRAQWQWREVLRQIFNSLIWEVSFWRWHHTRWIIPLAWRQRRKEVKYPWASVFTTAAYPQPLRRNENWLPKWLCFESADEVRRGSKKPQFLLSVFGMLWRAKKVDVTPHFPVGAGMLGRQRSLLGWSLLAWISRYKP